MWEPRGFMALGILESVSIPKEYNSSFAFTAEKASGFPPYEAPAVLAAIFPTRQMPFPAAGNCWP